MVVVGKRVFSFDKEVALDFLLDVEYKLLKSSIPYLKGPWGWFLGIFVKMTIRWQLLHTVEGTQKVEVRVSSFLKNKKYMKIRNKILAKGVLSDQEKEILYKRYLAAARDALTI